MFWFITDYSKGHHRKLLRELKKSLAPATWRNKEAHLKKLAQFCKSHSLNIQELKEYDVLSYILFLKEQLKSPGAVKNYLSTARTWTLALKGRATAFDTYNVAVLKRGLARTMDHTPQPALPVSPEQVEHMARVLDRLGKPARVAKAALLIGFFTALRQSNLVASNKEGKSPHALKLEDIRTSKQAIWVTVKSSKTTTAGDRPRVFKLSKHNNSTCCPVTAWRRYERVRRGGRSPLAFVTTSGSALTTNRLTKLLRLALRCSTYPAPHKFTLHALRRGAVHACIRAGSSIEQVRELGLWKSRAVNCYLPPALVSVAPTTLQACFG